MSLYSILKCCIVFSVLLPGHIDANFNGLNNHVETSICLFKLCEVLLCSGRYCDQSIQKFKKVLKIFLKLNLWILVISSGHKNVWFYLNKDFYVFYWRTNHMLNALKYFNNVPNPLILKFCSNLIWHYQ